MNDERLQQLRERAARVEAIVAELDALREFSFTDVEFGNRMFERKMSRELLIRVAAAGKEVLTEKLEAELDSLLGADEPRPVEHPGLE